MSTCYGCRSQIGLRWFRLSVQDCGATKKDKDAVEVLVQGGGTNLRIRPINVDVMDWVEADFVLSEQVWETSNGVANKSNSRPMNV